MSMTPAEAKAAFVQFKRDACLDRAHLHVSLQFHTHVGEGALQATFYPFGMTGSSKTRCTVTADDFATLLERLQAAWSEAGGRHRAERVRKMALEIIRITADRGACTEGDLRAGEFTAAEVEQFGAEAVEDANAIAQNGPFSIQRLAGANAA